MKQYRQSPQYRAYTRSLIYRKRQRRQPQAGHFTPEEYLRLMIESAQDYAIFATDTEGDITEWNPGAENIFGYSESEIIGQPGAILFTPEDRRRKVPEKELQTARQQGYAMDDRWHIRKDGSRFFASGVTRPMYDQAGVLRGYLKVARDITLRQQKETAEHERRLLAETLRDTALTLNSTLELEEVFDRILTIVHQVIPHDASQVILLKNGQIETVRRRGYPEEVIKPETIIPLKIRYLKQMYQTREALLISDTRVKPPRYDPLGFTAFAALIAVPIVDSDVMGFLVLSAAEPGFFQERYLEPLRAFAAQVMLAIRNASLFQLQQEMTILQERQRLSQDLHDSINQMLYASNLLAESLLKQADDHEALSNGLETMRRLNRGALAEIRTLLQELRSGDISEFEITMLLHQLAQSAMGHTDITVSLDIEMQHPLPKTIQKPLYRIAQEALNNVVKHARATEATIRLVSRANQVILSIKDNGRGFDPQAITSHNMGLNILNERAASIGAKIRIITAPDQGTEISVRWKPA